MSPENWQKIKAIFNEAVELAPAEREAFLKNQNGTRAEILAEVEKLLAAEEKSYFEKPLVNVAHLWQDEAAEDFTGKQIGDYKILGEIGRGGMGIVFKAERKIDDVSQTVALKILKRGMDSDALLRRFRHERRILAALEHPHIARLLDGGRDADGAPFFAMEFVDGKPIDEFCDKRNLSVSERLRLFLQICSAVSFAHSRLVVHRDLKPSNILVTNGGSVKLLDFGISKILSDDENLPHQTVTALGMMTPAYASPEQIRGETLTTASDIYSLGLILYELLTGAKAYYFTSQRPDEMAKVVCEVEPVRPSSVVSGQWSAVGGNSTNEDKGQKTKDRGQATNPKSKIQNPKSLKGDLDNIILKALRKEPIRRYASVEQFANDIERHLEGLPVIARPDTFSYRFEKFIARNRVSVIATMLVFFVLIAGIAATSWQAVRAEKQRKIAEQRFQQVRELANNVVFKYYDEAEKLSNSTLIREMFVKDSLDYFNSLAADEAADDELKTELGKAFLRIARVQGRPNSPNLGQTKSAIENYRKGIEILEPVALESEDVNLQSDLITAYADYAVVLKQNGNFSESAIYFDKAVTNGEAYLARHPESETLALRVVLAIMFRGDSLPVGENENIAAYRKSFRICDDLLRKNPDDLRVNVSCAAARERNAFALLTLARSARTDENFASEKHSLAEAETLFKQNVETGEKLVRLYPNQIISPALLASAQANYGTILIETEDYARALEFIQKAERFYRASLTSDNVSVGQKFEISNVEQKLGAIYMRTGNAAKAESFYKHAFELLTFLIEKDAENFDYIKARGAAKFDYADEFLRRGEIEKARQIYHQAFEETFSSAKSKDFIYAASLEGLYREKLGDCALAEAAKNQSSFENALIEYQKAAEIWRQNGVLNIEGNRQDEKLSILERKIVRLKNSLN